MDDIKIKAANPDNALELSELVSVFHESYGEQFPFHGVYDPAYWARNMGSRFISIMAHRNHRVLAHLAARPESKNSRVIQICFPACAREVQDRAVNITIEAWSLLERVAARQQWNAIYYAAFVDLELMQRVAVEALETSTTAIMPGYVPSQNPTCVSSTEQLTSDSLRSHVVVSQRILGHAAPHSAPLFVPARHSEMTKFLFSALGMPGAGVRMDYANNVERTTVPADAPAIYSRIFKSWDSAHFVVRPSLLQGFQQSLYEIDGAGAAHSFLFVDARDSACPSYCDFLEENRYIYSGILPNLFGTESLVYARPKELNIDVEAFVCPVAQRLARYMTEQGVRSSSVPLSTSSQRTGILAAN